jgi:hypothetical protein
MASAQRSPTDRTGCIETPLLPSATPGPRFLGRKKHLDVVRAERMRVGPTRGGAHRLSARRTTMVRLCRRVRERDVVEAVVVAVERRERPLRTLRVAAVVVGVRIRFVVRVGDPVVRVDRVGSGSLLVARYVTLLCAYCPN